MESRCIVFNDYLYILSRINYDYKYDLDILEKTPITIVSNGSMKSSVLNYDFSLGNYVINDYISKYMDYYRYNLLTCKFEKIDVITITEELNN